MILPTINPFRAYIYAGVALALVLAQVAFGTFLYRAGAKNVELRWIASVSSANEEARRMESLRQRNVDDAARAAAARTNRLARDAASARDAAGGLRDDLIAAERASQESRAAADNAVRTLSELFGECSRAYIDMAAEADRATSEVKTLRDAWPR